LAHYNYFKFYSKCLANCLPTRELAEFLPNFKDDDDESEPQAAVDCRFSAPSAKRPISVPE